VQRHRARRLHYDLRFEIDGVLVSWAVPRGPTLDPAVRRTAVHVEDHPIEYLHFEGVIPAGEYGGGDVIVWDTGIWEPHATDDPAAAVRAGELHADMYGEKLKGRLILVRRSRDPDERDQWLLLHKHDDDAVEGWEPEDHPRSVLSGRTNDEVKADPDRMWRSDLPPAQASVAVPGKGGKARNRGRRGKRAPAPARPVIAGPSADELAALDDLGDGGTWRVYGRALKLTNLGKDLFPGRAGEEPVTKRELIRYAAEIAPFALPYLKGRALNMHRFPGGASTKGFWHKQLPNHAPDWLPRWDNPEAEHGKTTTYLVVDEPAALIWAANFGALEWHAWTSLTEDPDRPSYALIDLDPGTATSWEELMMLARLHRTALDHLGMVGQPKLTGRHGVQIWIPVSAGTFEDTRNWVEQVSKAIGAVLPELVSWKWDVRDRGGLARLDYTQNVKNKTLIAPYSPRAAPGAPVSAPVTWDELEDPDLRSATFTIRDMGARLAELGDVFAPVLGPPQDLPPIT
jgi:bifunctional non-homologous end joining protein LigD